jgi:hypothetical protein
MTTPARHCRKGRQGAIPFDCKLDAGHEGKCTIYTLRPPTLEQWARMGAPWAIARLHRMHEEAS